MIERLLQRLRLRFGLRARVWPMATRNRRPRIYRRSAGFRIAERDQLLYVEPRRSA